jgi:uncharacterized membrane protein
MLRDKSNFEKTVNFFLKRVAPNSGNISSSYDLMSKHPHPGSLTAFRDILNEIGIQNTTLFFPESDKSQLLELPTPFVSHLFEQEFVVVEKISGQYVEYFKSDKGVQREKWEDFKKRCSGAVLIAMAEAKINRAKLQVSGKINKYTYSVGLTVFFIGSIIYIIDFLLQNSMLVNGIFFCKILGLMSSSILLLGEHKNSNSLVEKVCKAVNTDCNKVLESKEAKFLGVLNWSKLGFIYFLGGAIALLANSVQLILPFLYLTVLPCVLFTFYSLWFQIVKTKELCVFCLFIVLIFWIEFYLLNHTGIFSTFTLFDNPKLIFYFLSCFSFAAISIYLTDILLKKNKEQEKVQRKFNSIRFDERVVESLLNSQEEKVIPKDNLLHLHGETISKDSLVIITNPGCGPCAEQHKLLHRYFNGCYEDLKISIVFSMGQYFDKPEFEMRKVAIRIISIYLYERKDVVIEALDDWYAKNFSFADFDKKYPKIHPDAERILQLQHAWCTDNMISYTPTVFFNNKELPKYYSVYDVKYLING